MFTTSYLLNALPLTSTFQISALQIPLEWQPDFVGPSRPLSQSIRLILDPATCPYNDGGQPTAFCTSSHPYAREILEELPAASLRSSTLSPSFYILEELPAAPIYRIS